MVLVVLIMVTESVNALLPSFIPQEQIDMSAFEEEFRRFEIALHAPDTLVEKKKEQNMNREQFPKPYTYQKKALAERPPMMIEINTADSVQLVKLYGIGPSFAGRILKYRGMLGGFFSIEQLMEIYGMDSSRLNGFKGNIRIDTSAINKINVNEVDFKTLLHHPYLDYETVRLIFSYREYSGPIPNADTLRKVIAYDPMYELFKHYADY